MKIYIDLVLILNFCYDFLIILTVDVTLKRHMKVIRHIISAIIGSISIFILFLPYNNGILLLLKLITSIIMILVSFGYKNIKYFITNLIYLYMCSIILGGFLYLLENQFNNEKEYILLIIIAPIILYLYVKEHKKYISTIKYNYLVRVVFRNNKELVCQGYIDTGNKLRDPITKKYIVLISKKKLKPYINIRSPIYVPFKALNNNGIVECYSIKYINVNNVILTNYMVGIIDNISDCDCLLNYKIMEDICLKD